MYIYIYTRTCHLRPPLGLFKMALMDKWSKYPVWKHVYMYRDFHIWSK